MKSGVRVIFCLLFSSSLIQFAQAAEPALNSSANDTQAHIQALQQELSEAKDRVTELEAELSDAQSTIEQLNSQNDVIVVKEGTQPIKAIDQTVRGQPLYDVNNPQTPVEQENVIAGKFTS